MTLMFGKSGNSVLSDETHLKCHVWILLAAAPADVPFVIKKTLSCIQNAVTALGVTVILRSRQLHTSAFLTPPPPKLDERLRVIWNH